MNHTPTPWYNERVSNDYGTVSDNHACILAECGDPDDAEYIVRACNAYPALVAACQAIVAAFTTPVGVPIRKAFPTAQDPRSTYLSPAGIMVPSEVYELARNALAAVGESTEPEPHEFITDMRQDGLA